MGQQKGNPIPSYQNQGYENLYPNTNARIGRDMGTKPVMIDDTRTLDELIDSGSLLFTKGYAKDTDLINGTINARFDTLTANEYHVTIFTSSILFASGSSKFGDTNNDIHAFTGSIDVTNGIKSNSVEYSSSLYQSSSISGSVIEFNKGDNTTQQVQIPKGLGYSGLGWARYDDTTYTTSSAFTIVDGADVKIPCNGSGSIETHMHSPVPFFNPNSQLIQAENEGDVYVITLDFNMRAAVNPNEGDFVRLQMAGAIGTPYVRVGRDLFFAKNDTEWHAFHEIFQYYSDVDFITNGNEFNIIPHGTDIDIADVIIFIQRTQNHSQH